MSITKTPTKAKPVTNGVAKKKMDVKAKAVKAATKTPDKATPRTAKVKAKAVQPDPAPVEALETNAAPEAETPEVPMPNSTKNPSAPIVLHKEKLLPLILIRTDGGTQSRIKVDDKTVEEYAELMKDGVQFPKGVVYYDDHNYWLSAGFHRYFGLEKAGQKGMVVEVRKGGQREALLNGLADNKHGLKLSNADKRHVVETMLNDPEWRLWSNNTIARQCGVSGQYVRMVRSEKVEWLLPLVPQSDDANAPSVEVSNASAESVSNSVSQETSGDPTPETTPDSQPGSTEETPVETAPAPEHSEGENPSGGSVSEVAKAETPSEVESPKVEAPADVPGDAPSDAPLVQETTFLQNGQQRTRKITTPAPQPVGVIGTDGALHLASEPNNADDVFEDDAESAENAEARARVNEDDLTDEQWLAQLPLDAQLAPFSDAQQIFRADALSYRSFVQNGLFKELRKTVGAAVKFAKNQTPVFGSLLEMAQRFTNVKHPKEWKICPSCGGSRMVWIGRVKNDHLEPGTVASDESNMLSVRAKKVECGKCNGGYDLQ